MADDFTTPVPDGTKFAAKLIALRLFPWNLLADVNGADAMGEVQATPTDNTLLGRLKAIADAITTMDGHVDGLEGLATTLNSLVDGLETLIGTTNTNGGTTNTQTPPAAPATNPALKGTIFTLGTVSTTPRVDAPRGAASFTAALRTGFHGSIGYNFFGSNTSGARNNAPTDATDVALTANPFTDPSNNDFSLNSTAGGGAAAKGLGYPSGVTVP